MSSKSREVIIVGAFHEIVELCELCNYNIVGIIDGMQSNHYMGYSILGSDEEAHIIKAIFPHALIVVSPDSPQLKRKLVSIYQKAGFDFATVVSPYALVSRSAKIGKGTVIQSGVNISSFVRVGDFCKINFNANIMHDVQLGNFSIIAPNAVVLGRSKIGEGVYIGANSTIEHDSIIENGTRIQSVSYIVNHNE